MLASRQRRVSSSRRGALRGWPRYRAGVSMPRGTTLAGRLAAMGFADTARAEALLTQDLRLDIGGADAALLDAIAGAADPDLALTALARLPYDAALRAALRAEHGMRDRLIAVLGASAALGEHLFRHPGHWRVLAGPAALSRPTGAELRAEPLAAAAPGPGTGAGAGAAPGAGPGLAGDAVIALRVCYRRRLLHLAARDLTGAVTIDETAAELADLAAAALEGALAIARSRLGPLVRTLASHRAYYERWAKTWEFQAPLKARPVAGDADLGRAYIAALDPMVWQAAQREHFVADVQAMRRRVLESLPADQAGRELKLGPGGLRDIEFAVQLLQLVHGRTDETLRVRATLQALDQLAAGGYGGRQDAASLARAYRFLRRVEHLLQLYRLRRTHTLPEDPAVLRRVGRALHLTSGTGQYADPATELTARWREHASQARQLHEKLFYRPLLDAVARLPGEDVRLTPEAARARLEALGYSDPAGALRHIGALTAGASRKTAIQRTLLPVMLGWFADAAQPDAGLLAFRQVSEALGDSPWYLRLLRDDTRVAQRMARLLASSRHAAGLLLRAPDAVAMLADDAQLAPRQAAALQAEAAATAS